MALGYAAAIRRPSPPRWADWLDSRWAPLVAAIIAALAIGYVSGWTAPLPAIADESSYRLQAELFAAWKWADPSPPLPQFFEQLHVQVVPSFASKYFPGHALALAPGAVLGSPWLMALLMNAGAGALIFMLVRRHFDSKVALLALLLWLAAAGNLRWRATWYSEITTSILMLGAWWTAGSIGRRGTIAAAMVLVAMIAITRPLTAVAVGAVLGVGLLMRIQKERRLREFALGLAIGIVVLGVIPLWARNTTGSWAETPLSRYTADYDPWDRLGFGLDLTPPRREVPQDHQLISGEFIKLHSEHSLRSYARSVLDRVDFFMSHAASGWRKLLIPIAIVGLLAGGRTLVVPMMTLVLQFILYGFYAHPASWSLYYLELFPIPAVLAAIGMVVVMRAILGRSGAASGTPRWVTIAAIGIAVSSLPDLAIQRLRHSQHTFIARNFHQKLADLPGRSLVFVRYGPDHYPHYQLVTNLAPLDRQPTIIVHDRGDENLQLMASFPDRIPYLYDEAAGTMTKLVRRMGVAEDE